MSPKPAKVFHHVSTFLKSLRKGTASGYWSQHWQSWCTHLLQSVNNRDVEEVGNRNVPTHEVSRVRKQHFINCKQALHVALQLRKTLGAVTPTRQLSTRLRYSLAGRLCLKLLQQAGRDGVEIVVFQSKGILALGIDLGVSSAGREERRLLDRQNV